ncbi:hypothetical protein AVEN_192948-1 [Araneus ventricosus]|uniref:RNase H type-1 domain-containing protein n=1 Tax=Araneus ventricosus TaxID=182803 RepID=A0A4Y2X946_ARAVE|nr:hypothetical protein AVEN_192948-1 [Araneus ventricosus]
MQFFNSPALELVNSTNSSQFGQAVSSAFFQYLHLRQKSPIAQDIQQILYNSNTIKLACDEALDGTPGNEVADILAKQAVSEVPQIYSSTTKLP